MNDIQLREAQRGIPKTVGKPWIARYIYTDDRMMFADIEVRGMGALTKCRLCGCPLTRIHADNRVSCQADRCRAFCKPQR